jgi:hypothetical protein
MHLTKTVFSFLLLTIAMSSASQTYAQNDSVISVPSISLKDIPQASQNIYATPPSLTLIPHSPQAHNGNIWLRSADDGLHIWGKVEADEQGFHWPQQKSEMLSSDHIEVWLATSLEVPMPEIGWGNQFGTTELGSLNDCASQVDPHTGDAASGVKNCERWYIEQVQYRQYLRRLFVHQWLVAGQAYSGSHSFEDFASTAYAGLSANFFPEDLPTALKPGFDNRLTVEIDPEVRPETKQNAAGAAYKYYRQTGYHFHLLIPYSAFPPAQQLKLADLYLMIDVFSSAPAGHKTGDYSSTAAKRQWGQPASFNHVRLAAARTFSVTPCDFKPEQRDLYGESHAAWFFPMQSVKDADLQSTFALINPAGGYMYAPAGVSPTITPSNYFWKQLADDAAVCGPNLAWRKSSTITRTEFVVDEDHFEAKTLPDGWTLLRSGPSPSTVSRFGSGQCGACLVMDFDIFAVSPQGEITSALAIHETLTSSEGQPSAADLTIAPDWKQIILYRQIMDPKQTDVTRQWISTTYCLEGHAYKQCGESKQAQPPDPPHFKEFRIED